MNQHEIARKVLDHAEANYADGWDEIVECYSVGDLAEAWHEDGYKPSTVKGAVAWTRRLVKLRNDHRRDIQAEAW
jgi:hypothetical protein